jgi:hypothetical protein
MGEPWPPSGWVGRSLWASDGYREGKQRSGAILARRRGILPQHRRRARRTSQNGAKLVWRLIAPLYIPPGGVRRSLARSARSLEKTNNEVPGRSRPGPGHVLRRGQPDPATAASRPRPGHRGLPTPPGHRRGRRASDGVPSENGKNRTLVR